MQYESHKPYRRQPRRRTQYDGRAYARGGPERKPTERKPSRRREHAEEALRSVLDLFESGELPEQIAQTVIARQEGTSPMVNWSLGNQLLAIIAGTSDARGYRQWQEVGRHVRKGSKALYILAPSTRKIREQDADDGRGARADRGRRLRRRPRVPVRGHRRVAARGARLRSAGASAAARGRRPARRRRHLRAARRRRARLLPAGR